MALTGVPLLMVSVTATVACLVALVATWRRFGRWRVVTRTLGILLVEALALGSLGLVVNRVGDFYPSWAALVSSGATSDRARVATPNLEQWLAAHQTGGERDGLVFTWRPPDAVSWRLARPPVLFVPAAYFQHPEMSLPVVVAVAATKDRVAWDNRGVASLVRATTAGATSAVIAFVLAGRTTPAAALRAGLPYRLERDFRVTSGGWALVGVGSETSAAADAYTHDPGRYGSAALVDVRASAAVRPFAGGAPGSSVRWLAQLPAALRWAYAQLPPPLAAPLVDPPARSA
ncbi:MAG TPA: hypothetical protein VGJ63_01770 [Micromonosporaceae bacterium]|jgi:hypothetical protein